MKKFLALFSCAENSANHLEWMKFGVDAQKERLIIVNTAMESWTKKARWVKTGFDILHDLRRFILE
jgi:hypothetical protein